jgi:HK97 family phage major capsid protein
MKQVIKILADMLKINGVEYVKGQVLRIDESTAKELIENGSAEDYTEKAAQEALDKEVDARVQKALEKQENKDAGKEAEKTISKMAVSAAAPTLDPCAKYIGEQKTYTPQAVAFAEGKFLLDVIKEGSSGEQASDKLFDWKKACKAAGSGVEAGEDSLGGFLLAPLFDTRFMADQLEQSVIRPGATVISGQGRSLQLPMIDGRDHSSGKLFGNIDCYWEAENASISESRPKFERPELVKKKLTALVYISYEMQRYSPGLMGSMISPMLAQAMTWKEDHAFINGDGAGIPQGILAAPAAVSVAKETGQTAATITYVNALKMLARLWTFNRSSVAWLMNSDAIVQLGQMNLTIGTGGSAVYVPGDVNATGTSAFDRFMGLPVLYSEKCQALGTVGDIMLVDRSAYTIFDDASGMDIASSIHIKFVEAQEALRVLKLTDGQCRVASAFEPENGDSKSPIVTLAERA